MSFEVYGNSHKNQTFVALRFTKPVLRIHYKKELENIETDNILVLLSTQTVHTRYNTLTFVVGADCTTGAHRAESSREEDLLLSLLRGSEMLMHVFRQGVLYAVVQGPVNVVYEPVYKNGAFKSLYALVRASLDRVVGYQNMRLCSSFRGQGVAWKKWSAWWCVAQRLFSHMDVNPMTLGKAKRFAAVYHKSQKEYALEPSDIYRCEIELCDKSLLGILYTLENDRVTYVSPMVVSNTGKSIKDVNYVVCHHWLPLYYNQTSWLTEGIFHYCHSLFEKQRTTLRQVLDYLSDKRAEKYDLIRRDLEIVWTLLN